MRHARRRSGERHERSIPRPPALPAPLADPPTAPQPTHTRLRRARFCVDALDRADELELGDLVDEVEVVEVLDAVEVSLVDGIDPQVAGLSEGLGPAPLADGDVHGAGRRGHRPAPALIAGRVAQVVEVSVGDGGEALEAAVAEQLQGPDAELAGGRTGEGAVEGIDFGEQPDVGLGVAAWEGVPGRRRSAMAPVVRCWCSRRVTCARERPVTLFRKRRIRPLSAFPRRE